MVLRGWGQVRRRHHRLLLLVVLLLQPACCCVCAPTPFYPSPSPAPG